jgi:hypothetical protein
MKAANAALIFVLMCGSVFAQPLIRLYTGERLTQEEFEERKRIIEGRVEDYAKIRSPYFKLSNGNILYLGKMLYQAHGILPKPPVNKNNTYGTLLMRPVKVLDSGSNGSRIAEVDEDGIPDADDDIFLEGFHGYSDRIYPKYLVVERMETDYEYRTIAGGTRVIPRYRMPTEATKEEYLAYVAKREAQKVVNTNSIPSVKSPTNGTITNPSKRAKR